MNRAQVSLIFTNDDVYNNLILEMKQSRSLSPFIIKCITAYYYDAEVRARIDGHVEEPVETVNVQSEIDNIRSSLFMQACFAEEGLNTLESGKDDIEDILKYSSEKVKEYEETHGSTKTETVLPQIEKANESSKEQGADSTVDKRLHMLEQSVNSILDLLRNNVSIGAVQMSGVGDIEEVTPDKVENTSLTEVSESVLTPTEKEIISEATVERQEEVIEEEPISVEEDGTDSLLALLESM